MTVTDNIAASQASKCLLFHTCKIITVLDIRTYFLLYEK